MFADADHEVIDSPEALFRHLSEEHGVEEARELDPETAPLQFWLRRHADLERAERAARRQPEPPTRPGPTPGPPAEPRTQSRPQQPEARSRAPSPPQPEARSRGESRSSPPPPPAAAGRRHAGFGDPLVEAMARALAGRGFDEAAVRSAIRSFHAPGPGPAGEAGVRAAFVEPMLQSVAEHLLDAGGSRRPAARPQPPPAAPPPPPARPAADPAPAAAREEPARPEAAWAVLWADLADPGRRAGAATGTPDDDGDDLMAVANAIQGRRRVRRLRR
jgi:hypothetical protein